MSSDVDLEIHPSLIFATAQHADTSGTGPYRTTRATMMNTDIASASVSPRQSTDEHELPRSSIRLMSIRPVLSSCPFYSRRMAMLARLLARTLPVALALWIHAEPGKALEWRVVTEYPLATVSGNGVATFASLVNAHRDAGLYVAAEYDSPVKSGDIGDATHANLIQGGDAFGGGLAKTDAVFQLSSLPFVTNSIEDACRLAYVARDAYRRAFAARGLHLLYVTPWPPTGLWSDRPIRAISDLHGLTVRTYDPASESIMQAAGAAAITISFANIMARLEQREVNAVLSSGDGAAGSQLARYLDNYTAINYAIPLSFFVVSEAAYQQLTSQQRDVVDAAATQTEAYQWARVRQRVDRNLQRMRADGVVIASNVDPMLQDALKNHAQRVVKQWVSRVGPLGAGLLGDYCSTAERPSNCLRALHQQVDDEFEARTRSGQQATIPIRLVARSQLSRTGTFEPVGVRHNGVTSRRRLAVVVDSAHRVAARPSGRPSALRAARTIAQQGGASQERRQS